MIRPDIADVLGIPRESEEDPPEPEPQTDTERFERMMLRIKELEFKVGHSSENPLAALAERLSPRSCQKTYGLESTSEEEKDHGEKDEGTTMADESGETKKRPKKVTKRWLHEMALSNLKEVGAASLLSSLSCRSVCSRFDLAPGVLHCLI